MAYDMIVKNCWVFNSFLKRFNKVDVAIKEGKFAYLATSIKEDGATIIDGQGAYMIPGLIDIHMHIESSMSIPSRFADAVLPHGTTTVVADPHEIANVFGEEGILFFLAQKTPLDIFYGIPSSVPATNPHLETTGGLISEKEVISLMNDPRIICLGEVMNFHDVCYDNNSLSAKIIAACQKQRFQMPLEGHCPKISGEELAHFISKGISADHTHQTAQSVYEKITNGMFLEIQRKSMSQEVIDTLIKNQFMEYFCLVTDDVMADKLRYGHLNELVALAIKLGMPKEMAIYCATFTPARRMHLEDRGAIAPGRIADFILLDDVENFKIKAVYKKGINVESLPQTAIAPIPCAFRYSLKCAKADKAAFSLEAKGQQALCNIMAIEPHSTFTHHQQRWLTIKDGKIQWQKELALLTVFERYGKSGKYAHGLVANSLKAQGAIATTWAHDHHNVLVLGTNEDDMLMAQHELINMQGGFVVVKDQSVIAKCCLEIGGIVSARAIDKLGDDLEQVRAAMQQLGYEHDNEIMSISTLSLLVSPALKISDKGLVLTKEQKIIELVEEIR
ncbi:MAG: amidohydrolase family protein [Erysipelotrichaceae bacterium]|nr:amidohydrolase family protein [Erysipelotrichaceae bacterium]MDY5252542.1 adenine deaminase C-terminal domain-containing protein [Erysipelotrichaceae bacterium]